MILVILYILNHVIYKLICEYVNTISIHIVNLKKTSI